MTTLYWDLVWSVILCGGNWQPPGPSMRIYTRGDLPEPLNAHNVGWYGQ